MFELKIKGESLEELKTKVKMVNTELNGEKTVADVGAENTFDDLTEIARKTPKTVTATQIKEVTVAEAVTTPNALLQDLPMKESPVVEQDVAIHDVSNVCTELDSEGLPWDARINNKKRTKMKSGAWKVTKGTDKLLVEQVKAELRANTPAVIAPVAPILETPVIPTAVTSVAAPVAPAPAPVLPNLNGGHTVETFTASFPMIVGSLISEGKVTADYINSLKEYFKVTEIWDTTAEQKAMMFEEFAKHGFITKV